MPTRRARRSARNRVFAAGLCIALLMLAGCNSFPGRHERQSDNWTQLLLSEESQVKVRSAQSRVYDTTDKQQMLAALVAAYQDLGFHVEVLDETLGIISGKRYLEAERPADVYLPTYLLYDEESLVVFNRVYRNWGPFQARADMIRLTATIRQRNAQQLIVRASAQYFLRPVEAAEAYQQFFATLEQALFAQRASLDPPPVSGAIAEAVGETVAEGVAEEVEGVATSPAPN